MVMVMTVLYFFARSRKNVNIVDVGWAGGMAFAVLFLATSTEAPTQRVWWVGSVALWWAFRLAYYLFKQRVLQGEEDSRYRSLRIHWGKKASWGFFGLFQAQAFLVVWCVLPIYIAMHNPSPFAQWFDGAALLIWLIAIVGETIADEQLSYFKSHPANRGKVCQKGLWRYSRHPNYFFEWLHWWTYIFFAVGSPWFGWTLLGPVSMYLFLIYITGIPHAERESLASRGDAYRHYQKTTNRFFPWRPKS